MTGDASLDTASAPEILSLVTADLALTVTGCHAGKPAKPIVQVMARRMTSSR
jgi:hypothetical protein